MSDIKVYYAIYDGMAKGTPSDGLVTFVEKRRTKQPLFSGGGNLGFVRLVRKSDHDAIVKAKDLEIEALRRFGNKDCINQADEWLEQCRRAGGKAEA